ncbi:MAG TPA: hypothetical protein VKV19_08715 [Ktedonobacteraceae bacterium]|nr:hypothetical protein [Ktedonobacteraceae bacterium]
MSKIGKFTVALALGLFMSLALLTTGSFAQSANSHVANTPAHTTVAHAARWGGWWWGGCGCGCWCGCWNPCGWWWW